MTDKAIQGANFWQSLKIQLRVLEALILREVLTRYGRHNLGFLWLFFEPALFCAAVVFAWTIVRNKGAGHAGISIPAFALTGYCTILLWRQASNRCASAIDPNMNLLFHRNVRILDLFLSRLFLEIISITAAFILLTLLFAFMGYCNLPASPLLAVYAWMLLCWFSIGLGLCVGAIANRYKGFSRFWQVSIYILFPLSGAVYMAHWLPSAMREIVLWIPTVHVTEMLRHGFYGDAVRTYENPGYLAFVNLCLTLAGLALVRINDRRITPE